MSLPGTQQTSPVGIRVSIGDFSRMTYLSVKALRRYHDMGLLVPATVDGATGYRYYEAAQVPVGQVIRRFRDLGMPLEQLKAVLDAPDHDSRNELIVAHLRRMEGELARTQDTVASLRALLEQPRSPIEVEYRSAGATQALAVAEPVAWDDFGEWFGPTFDELHAALAPAGAGARRAGPDGALFPNAFFEEELGEVVAFVPLAGEVAGITSGGRVRLLEIPAAELAVTVHHGALDGDQTYGALGTFVAEREIGVVGPIREHYLVGARDTPEESAHRTEVCWPVFRTRGEGT
jgi:DNA-binding transcriptional MerR regulator/effector-binding domain-containing protein